MNVKAIPHTKLLVELFHIPTEGISPSVSIQKSNILSMRAPGTACCIYHTSRRNIPQEAKLENFPQTFAETFHEYE